MSLIASEYRLRALHDWMAGPAAIPPDAVRLVEELVDTYIGLASQQSAGQQQRIATSMISVLLVRFALCSCPTQIFE